MKKLNDCQKKRPRYKYQQQNPHHTGLTQQLFGLSQQVPPPQPPTMFRFAQEIKFAYMDAFYINMRMDYVVKRITENNINKAVFLLDDTLLHLQSVGSDVDAPWKEELENEILSLIMLLMVGVTNSDQVTEHINNINEHLLRNEFYKNRDRWGTLMASRLVTNNTDVGVLGGLPNDIMWRIAQTIMVN